VFGPLGGGQIAPAAARAWLGDSWHKERLRNATVRAVRYVPAARAAVKNSVVLVTNDDTARLAHLLGARDIRPMAHTGVSDELVHRPRLEAAGRRLIWVGSDRPRKGLTLALQAIAASDAKSHCRYMGLFTDEGVAGG
jgi:hypothetical protein